MNNVWLSIIIVAVLVSVTSFAKPYPIKEGKGVSEQSFGQFNWSDDSFVHRKRVMPIMKPSTTYAKPKKKTLWQKAKDLVKKKPKESTNIEPQDTNPQPKKSIFRRAKDWVKSKFSRKKAAPAVTAPAATPEPAASEPTPETKPEPTNEPNADTKPESPLPGPSSDASPLESPSSSTNIKIEDKDDGGTLPVSEPLAPTPTTPITCESQGATWTVPEGTTKVSVQILNIDGTVDKQLTLTNYITLAPGQRLVIIPSC